MTSATKGRCSSRMQCQCVPWHHSDGTKARRRNRGRRMTALAVRRAGAGRGRAGGGPRPRAGRRQPGGWRAGAHAAPAHAAGRPARRGRGAQRDGVRLPGLRLRRPHRARRAPRAPAGAPLCVELFLGGSRPLFSSPVCRGGVRAAQAQTCCMAQARRPPCCKCNDLAPAR